ncbi:MAG: hypothetical protein EA428_07795 [Spirochaetaceae bacterium]|nr:MAG: hypothetical protein EA428_07795 [Spirochaetaceae bacterium]
MLGLLYIMGLLVFVAVDVAAGDSTRKAAGHSGIEELVALFDLVAAGRRTEASNSLGGLFSAGFLRDVGSQSILGTVQRIAEEHGSVQAVSATPEPNEYELLFADDMVLAVGLHVEVDAEEEGRIGGIQLGRPRTLERLLQDRVQRFASVHWDTRVFVAPFGDDTLIEFDGRVDSGGPADNELSSGDLRQDRDRRRAEQSVVMYPGQELEHLRLVLRVVRAVVDGNMELSNVVRLNASYIAEEGLLSEKAPGTPYTLYSLSEYLLFEKDETAQRHLEAALRAQRGAARTEIDWSYRSLYELLERSTVLGGRGYSPIDHLLHSFFFVEAAGADAAAVMLVPGRNGTTHYVAVSQHDPDQEPTPESLRRDLELLAVPLRLLP